MKDFEKSVLCRIFKETVGKTNKLVGRIYMKRWFHETISKKPKNLYLVFVIFFRILFVF